MATNTAAAPAATQAQMIDNFDELMNKTVRFKPFGSEEVLELSLDDVMHLIAKPTRSGALPSEREVMLMLKLCKHRGLNPYVGDVVLTGYDTKDGPTFSAIVTIQAMFKRADANEHYQGKEMGVIVWDTEAKSKKYIEGVVVPKTENVIGGWCTVYRDDRKPEKAETLMSAYNPGHGYWNKDANWMIAKCAAAAALRQAFPNDLDGLEIKEEVDALHLEPAKAKPVATPSGREKLKQAITPVAEEPVKTVTKKGPNPWDAYRSLLDDATSVDALHQICESFCKTLTEEQDQADASFECDKRIEQLEKAEKVT